METGSAAGLPGGLDLSAVSVVIRCYNEEDHIGRLLQGISRQTVRDVEIIVVDSGSTDGTLAVVAQYPAKVVTVPPQEFSFGRSLNFGCAAAGGDYIVIASAHVYPLYDDWIERLLAPFADPRVALTYGRQCGDDRTRYAERQVFAHWFPPASDLNRPTAFCNNANAAIRRGIWERFSYDEELTGLEDLEWARRVKRAGYRIAYVAEDEVAHPHHKTYHP